jgi:hypothetical protein
VKRSTHVASLNVPGFRLVRERSGLDKFFLIRTIAQAQAKSSVRRCDSSESVAARVKRPPTPPADRPIKTRLTQHHESLSISVGPEVRWFVEWQIYCHRAVIGDRLRQVVVKVRECTRAGVSSVAS